MVLYIISIADAIVQTMSSFYKYIFKEINKMSDVLVRVIVSETHLLVVEPSHTIYFTFMRLAAN